MAGRFPGCICAVMAACAVGRHREGTVIHLGSGPGAGGFVAGFAHRDAVVDGGVGLGGQTKGGCGVAAGAAGGRRYVGVVLGGQPAREAALVASNTASG